jgi:phage recombination protein Bet
MNEDLPIVRTPRFAGVRKREGLRNPYSADGLFRLSLPKGPTVDTARWREVEQLVKGKRCANCSMPIQVGPKDGAIIMRCQCYPNPPAIQRYGNRAKERLGDIIMQQLATRGVESIQAADVRLYIAPGASDQQIAFFLKYCVFEGLNPFKNEVYYVPFKNGATGKTDYAIVTGIDTYRKRASSHPSYAGHQTGVMLQGEDGTIRFGEGEYRGDNERLVGGWCDCYHKGNSRAFRHTVKLENYDKRNNVWAHLKELMIAKVAEGQALRKHYPESFADLNAMDATVMTDADFPGEALPSSATLVLPQGKPGPQQDLLCPIHKKTWFKTGKMPDYAHPIDGQIGPRGGKIWCNREQVLAELKDADGELPDDAVPAETTPPIIHGYEGDPPQNLGSLFDRCVKRWGKYKQDVLDALNTPDPKTIVDLGAAWEVCIEVFGGEKVPNIDETEAPDWEVCDEAPENLGQKDNQG